MSKVSLELLPMRQHGENAEDVKPSNSHIEEVTLESKGGVSLKRTKADNLSGWQAIKQYRLISFISFLAAFCASLDGYQITLNGGIVSNAGFITLFAPAGSTAVPGKYVSAWGGIQSTGQFVGQVLLQFATDAFGRKPALLIIWVALVASIFAETFATTWQQWLAAKLFSGLGVGMLQATVPVYISEMAPTPIRGLLVNAYTFWFVLGQLCGAIALNEINKIDPLNFRLAIYTQWAMVGVMGLIFAFLPETPWWLVGKGKTDRAAKVLARYHHLTGDDGVTELIGVMMATIEKEQAVARSTSQDGFLAVFQGRNRLRFLIASWPKITQQLVGLTVFNTFATYFFQEAGNKDPFLVTVILTSCQIAAMILTAISTDALGRRPLTVYPYAVASLSVLSLGIIGCFDDTAQATSSLLVFFACVATFTTTGASSIGYAYAAEIPQQRLRARTSGWALAFSNLVAILFNFTTPLMINGPVTHWGVKTGFFFAGTGTVAVLVAWYIMPEIARRTPAEINEMFEKKIDLRRFKGYVTEVEMNTTATGFESIYKPDT